MGVDRLTQSVGPDLPIFGASEPSLDGEFLKVRITTILIDACAYELPLLDRQKGDDGSKFLVVREGYQEYVTKEGDQAGQLFKSSAC